MHTIFIPIFILLFLSSAWSEPGFHQTLFSAEDETNGWKDHRFADTVFEDVHYTGTELLEKLFSQKGIWVPERQKFLITDRKGDTWYFSLDNPYVIVEAKAYNLTYPVRRGPQLLYIPTLPLLKILEEHSGHRITYNHINYRGNLSGTVPTPAAKAPLDHNIIHISSEERDNGTLVSIETASQLSYQTFWVPPHFILKLFQGRLNPVLPQKLGATGLVRGISNYQEKDLAQITLHIPKTVDTVEVTESNHFSGYLINVRKKPEKSFLKAVSQSKTQGRKTESRIRNIIIDPGHGGKDPGAQTGGLNEAEITLKVALELKTILEKDGFKAMLTREEDKYLTLEERPKFASEKSGDLFISLHCNSIGGSPSRKKRVSGFVVYILREGESEEDKALARRENQAVEEESVRHGKKEISPVEWILLEHQLNLYSKESEAVAEKIVEEFREFDIPKYSTGARQAGFYVLVGAYMPAVLFEMGFLTNDLDRKVMRSPKGRREIARRLAKAIKKYSESLGGKS